MAKADEGLMAKSELTRRRFLAEAAKVSLAAPALALGARELWAQAPSAPTNLRVVLKNVLSQSDVTFLGAFRLPFSVAGLDASYGRGLTHRYANGALHFLGMTTNSSVFEVIYPGTAAASPYPLASVFRAWGDVGQGVRFTNQYGVNSGIVNGLYWDDQDQRLYWSYANDYNVVYPNDPSVGYSTLDDSTGTPTPVGMWQFSGRGPKATEGGVLPIPKWFADAYCQGRRLGAGFGGYFNAVGTGPAHMGPALCAFNPPDVTSYPSGSSIPFANLVGYPYNPTPYTTPDRCHRDTDYTNEFDGWNPQNGVGYWSWTDFIWQGAVWLDLPTKHGVLFFPTLGNGRTWYETSTLHAERGSHWCFVYDPTDFVSVLSGAKQQWQIQPQGKWAIQYPSLTYPLPGWANEPTNMVTGATYDATTQRLYVSVRLAWAGTNAGEYGSIVYAYQVS